MNKTPLISVILPVYNVEKYLKQSIESVINQTYSNLEIILVDDGSTDSSGSICSTYAKRDSRIKVVKKKNGGLNLARRDGYEKSTGEWITFVDSDDVVDKNYVQYLLDGALKYKTNLAVCGYRNFVDDINFDDRRFSAIYKDSNASKKLFLLDEPPVKNLFMQTAWGKIINRNIMESVDWNFSNYKTNEDEFMAIFYYSLLTNGVAFLDNQLYLYRQRPDSIMDKNQKEYINFYKGKQLNRFDFLNEVYKKRLSKFGKKYINEIAFWFTLHFIISTDKQLISKGTKISKRDAKIFDSKLPQIKRAIKKYPLYGQHGGIIKRVFMEDSIMGLYNYRHDSPLVSIIVPVFNSEKYIYECLESLVNQTYNDVEIIVVDDGSTDESENIYKKFSESDNRVKVIKKENGGVSSARNAGIGIASGQYIIFVDSDDLLDLGAVKKLVDAAVLNNHQPQIIVAGIKEYHSNGMVFDTYTNTLPKNTIFSHKDNTANTIHQMMTTANAPHGKLISKEFVVKNNLEFPEDIRIGEDLVFITKAYLMARSIYTIEDNISFYRRGADNINSATGSVAKSKALDFSKALAVIHDFIKSSGLDKNKQLLEGFKASVINHCLYNLELTEKNPAIHKLVFKSIHTDILPTYGIDSSHAFDKNSQDKLTLIEDGDYTAFILRRVDDLKSYNQSLLETIEKFRGNKYNNNLVRLVPGRLKRPIIRAAKKVKRGARRVLR